MSLLSFFQTYLFIRLQNLKSFHCTRKELGNGSAWRIRLQKVPFITPEYLHYTSFSWQWSQSHSKHGRRERRPVSSCLPASDSRKGEMSLEGGGWVGGGVRKDKHWSMWSGAMISFVYRPFPELPELNGSHTNHSAAVSIYSGNISIKEIKPYKPILIIVLLPFMITCMTFFTSGRLHYSCGIQHNNNNLPCIEP